MFNQLFFLLLTLILINFDHPSAPIHQQQDFLNFLAGIGVYCITLALLAFQASIAKYFKRYFTIAFWITITNIELLIFLVFSHFVLGFDHFLQIKASNGYDIQTLSTLMSLTLYLFGIGWSHYFLSLHSMIHTHQPLNDAFKQIQFLFPFCIPYFMFSIILDGLESFPLWVQFQDSNTWLANISYAALNLGLLFLTLLVMPAMMIRFWNCKPLPNDDLRCRLEKICQHFRFKYAGIKLWTVMKHSLTAGIIGLVAPFRYIMFTERLVQTFTPEEIESILIHEIGHSRYKHLLFYPFILLGMVVLGALIIPVIIPPISHFFSYQNARLPSAHWDLLSDLSILILYIITLWLYFRLVFGFYSRLFERQADLHIFEYPFLLPIYMVRALNHLGTALGNIHHQPSWHHFSIQERMNFLIHAIHHPEVITLHHRRVKKWLIIYFILLLSGICLLIKRYFL